MTGRAEGFVLRQGQPGDWPAVRALLVDAGLPVDDLGADSMPQFTIAAMAAADGETLAGVVALQPFNAVGLLRSLAVAQEARSAGCGSKLVQAVERTAGRSGVRQLWLLTTGAEHYFEMHGFLVASRALAPPEIRQTAEFTSLCPDSAVLMSKSLQP